MRPSTPYTINTKGHTVYQCGQPSSTMLHEPHLEHAEHSSFSATGMEFGCVVNTRQAVTLASQDSLAQLCDSIRQAPAPSAIHFTSVWGKNAALSPLGWDHSASSEVCGRACPSSRDEDRLHTSTRSFPSGCPCHLTTLPKLQRVPLPHWGKQAFTSSIISTTGYF